MFHEVNTADFKMETKWKLNGTEVGVDSHLIDLYESLPPTTLV